MLAAPTLLTGELAVAHYEEIMGAAGEALGIGMEPIDDALQTFDVLRLCAEIMNNENFQASVDGYALTSAKVGAMAHVDQAAHHAARTELQGVIDRVGESCRVYGSHILAQERTINAQEGRRWHSPVAERLAQEVQRAGEQHPLVSGMQRKPDAMWLALKGVSAAVGRRAWELEWQATPVGRFDFIPVQVWLDTGRPPASP